MKSKQFRDYLPALTARTQLGQILNRYGSTRNASLQAAQRGAHAVIMSVQDDLKNFAADAAALKKVQRRAEPWARAGSRLKH